MSCSRRSNESQPALRGRPAASHRRRLSFVLQPCWRPPSCAFASGTVASAAREQNQAKWFGWQQVALEQASNCPRQWGCEGAVLKCGPDDHRLPSISLPSPLAKIWAREPGLPGNAMTVSMTSPLRSRNLHPDKGHLVSLGGKGEWKRHLLVRRGQHPLEKAALNPLGDHWGLWLPSLASSNH